MKSYSIKVSVCIHDKGTTYPEMKPIDFTIFENLPRNVDPHKFLRQRIAEELSRNFAAISAPIENRDEGAETDALSE